MAGSNRKSGQKAFLMKPLKSRGFRRASVNQCVLVRIPTGELVFGFEIRPFSVNRLLGELVLQECAFFARKLAIFGPAGTLLSVSASRKPGQKFPDFPIIA